MKKRKWIICPCCDGEATVDNPAFSNGFTSSEWHNMHVDEQQSYMAGHYDVPCTECDGLGRVRVPNVAAMTFGEKRQLVLERRESRINARLDAEIAAERAAERALGC
ncbi:TPA: hypothetical protein ACNVX4_006404 [Pseudomonas aeruginosa]